MDSASTNLPVSGTHVLNIMLDTPVPFSMDYRQITSFNNSCSQNAPPTSGLVNCLANFVQVINIYATYIFLFTTCPGWVVSLRASRLKFHLSSLRLVADDVIVSERSGWDGASPRVF